MRQFYTSHVNAHRSAGEMRLQSSSAIVAAALARTGSEPSLDKQVVDIRNSMMLIRLLFGKFHI